MTQIHHHKPKFQINWSVFLTSIATTIVLLAGAWILQSWESPKTTKDIDDIKANQKFQEERINKQDIFNAKAEVILEDLKSSIHEIKDIIKQK